MAKKRRTTRENPAEFILTHDLYHETISSLKEGIIFIENDENELKIIDLNESALRFCGITREEALGYRIDSKSMDFEIEDSKLKESMITLDSDRAKNLSGKFWKLASKSMQKKEELSMKFDNKIDKEGSFLLFATFIPSLSEPGVSIVRIEGHFHRLELEKMTGEVMDLDEQQWCRQVISMDFLSAQMLYFDPYENDMFNLYVTEGYTETIFMGMDMKNKWFHKDVGIGKEQLQWFGNEFTRAIGKEETLEMCELVRLPVKDFQAKLEFRYLDSKEKSTGISRRLNESEKDLEGFMHRFLIVSDDVTAKLKLEEDNSKKNRMNELQRMFIDGCDILMTLVTTLEDNHLHYIMANRKAISFCESMGMYGLKEGSTSRDINLSPEHLEFYQQYINEVKETGKKLNKVVHDTIFNTWFDLKVFPVAENTYGFLLTDTTGSKRLEEEIVTRKNNLEEQVEERTRELNQALNAKSRFLATMSHEIRTPLVGIMESLNHFSEMENLNDDSKEMINIGKVCSEQLLAVINDVLDLSKIEANEIQLDLQPDKIYSVIEQSIEVVHVQSSKKNLPIIYESLIPLEYEFQIDKGRLRQILINLLSNATKFTEKGEIIVRSSCKNLEGSRYEVHISVKDTGIGISDEFQKKIFKPFVQSDPSITRKYGGSGLGLSISKRFAELMGGRIWIESDGKNGSTFHLTLVTVKSESVDKESELLLDIEKALLSLLKSKPEKKKVVIIEKNTSQLEVLTRLLNGFGFTSHSVTSAKEMAVNHEMLKESSLVIVDITEGEEELKQISTFCESDRKGLIMTGTIKQLTDRGASEGTVNTWRKPFKIQQIHFLLDCMFLSNQFRKKSLELNSLSRRRSLKGISVLVAEDNLLNQKVIIKMLNKLGIHPVVVEDGLKALEALEKQQFEIILMDCMMPNMGGIEATQEIRKRFPAEVQPVIIALTADAMADNSQMCIEAGMDGVLTKPVSLDQLHKSLTTTLM